MQPRLASGDRSAAAWGGECSVDRISRCLPPPRSWEYESSPYGKKKYAVLLAGLPRPTYDHILEIGCSIGVFTEMLARKGKQVTGVDISEKATALTSSRCRHLGHVRVRTHDFLDLREKGI